MRCRTIGLLAGLGVLIAATAGAALYLSYYRLEGYFAPIYSPDGKSIYYVQRNTTGFAWGLGFEFFTPPAHSWALSDVVTIRQLDVDSGATTVLRRWDSTPVSERHLREYRGRLFQILYPHLGWDPAGNLHYAIELSVTRIPTSEQHALIGQVGALGDLGEIAGWQDTFAALTVRDGPVLSDNWEVMEVPGRESYPSALVAFDGRANKVRVFLSNSDYRGLYPNGVPIDLLRQRARRADIERVQEIERVQGELVAKHRAEGASEGDAILRANKDMQQLGYFPKSPTLTARLLTGGETHESGLAEFTIEPMQFTVGLFPDIEQAIAAPGTVVDKDGSDYMIHHDYETSQRLNAYLATGAKRFYVRYAGQVYELTIDRP